MSEKELNRFFAKINKTESCWIWTGACSKGYGSLTFRNKTVSAHRLSFIYHKHDIPVNLIICHSCDNPKCVNPEHLFMGTQKDNIQDAIKKGRHVNTLVINNLLKTHCPRNHEYNKNNLIKTSSRKRRCKICEKQLRLYRKGLK